jgi:predicted nucleotidyltransferase
MSKKVEPARQIIEKEFVDKVKGFFGESLVSIILYGSYVSGNYVHGVSDINTLIILSDSDFKKIKAFGAETHRLLSKYKITPLILLKEEFLNSSDVFPMEYMDMNTRYELLFGEDVVRKLALSKNNLRHQLEFQLRGSVNSLRQLIIASQGKTRVLGKNIKIWYGSISALFRGILRLKGVNEVPREGEEVLATIREVMQFDTGPFSELLAYRSGAETDVEGLTTRVLSSLKELVRIVDSMELNQ